MLEWYWWIKFHKNSAICQICQILVLQIFVAYSILELYSIMTGKLGMPSGWSHAHFTIYNSSNLSKAFIKIVLPPNNAISILTNWLPVASLQYSLLGLHTKRFQTHTTWLTKVAFYVYGLVSLASLKSLNI